MTNNKAKYGLENIRMPHLSQVQTFVRRIRDKVKPKSNNLKDIIEFMMSNLIFPTISEDAPFFFGYEVDALNQIRL